MGTTITESYLEQELGNGNAAKLMLGLSALVQWARLHGIKNSANCEWVALDQTVIIGFRDRKNEVRWIELQGVPYPGKEKLELLAHFVRAYMDRSV